ncbi:unnamed protein product [Trichobilharzia regenti]|nr:unnamed protein product [Trichobilharzia regenti]
MRQDKKLRTLGEFLEKPSSQPNSDNFCCFLESEFKNFYSFNCLKRNLGYHKAYFGAVQRSCVESCYAAMGNTSLTDPTCCEINLCNTANNIYNKNGLFLTSCFILLTCTISKYLFYSQ